MTDKEKAISVSLMKQKRNPFSRVLFLDYDGVVNTPMWNDAGTRCKFNFPSDNKVNNFQAVQWVSEFCNRFHYNIVVTSTWRRHHNYVDCLKNGGLRSGIEILGKTDDTYSLTRTCRGDEIKHYIDQHPQIKFYLIVDDEDDMLPEQANHFVKTDTVVGFNELKYDECRAIYMKDLGHGNSFWG